jgi:hypothetical protein
MKPLLVFTVFCILSTTIVLSAPTDDLIDTEIEEDINDNDRRTEELKEMTDEFIKESEDDREYNSSSHESEGVDGNGTSETIEEEPRGDTNEFVEESTSEEYSI